jgi:glycosyltransferase involved in cell wall biosynthesis
VRILIDYRPALRQRTGVGEYMHGIATALVPLLRAGDSLTLFSSSWKDRLTKAAVTGASQVDLRIPVRLLNLAWHRLEWPPVDWLAGRSDIVHASTPLLIPARRGARVVTIHDLHFLDRPEDTTAEVRRDYSALAGDHARRADAVMVNSEYTRQQVVDRLGIDKARVTVCTPGRPDWARRPEPGLPGPILFIGTLEPRKNLRRLVEAYAMLLARREDLPDLVLAGRVLPGELFADTPAFAELRERIHIAGYVSDEERLRLYREASMLVLPSLDEGFGITALEAMTIGLPVVASDRGALPEVVGSAGILVHPEDPAALAAAIERVLDDPDLRRRMSDEGVARAARFSWATSAAALHDAYREAHARRGGR